ncbi:unnamed protein product [Schistocephalus solidus]|uniref:Uncharacterized protein n=1 Tax=Schistocephalus solidus TaxID=70667 RepID=A0A183TAB7_SCHSO|nr:unnamed protein product [Schistocephalus solidus]
MSRSVQNSRSLPKDSVVDFQRQLRVLARQAYPNEPSTEREASILQTVVNGISLPEIRRQFLRDPLSSINVALDITWREEAIHSPVPWPKSPPHQPLRVTKPLPPYRTTQSMSSP